MIGPNKLHTDDDEDDLSQETVSRLLLEFIQLLPQPLLPQDIAFSLIKIYTSKLDTTARLILSGSQFARLPFRTKHQIQSLH